MHPRVTSIGGRRHFGTLGHPSQVSGNVILLATATEDTTRSIRVWISSNCKSLKIETLPSFIDLRSGTVNFIHSYA